MPRLTEDEKDLMRAMLMEGEGVKVILKELERMCDLQDFDLVKYDLTASGDDRKLFNLKLRAEGARKLFVDFCAHLNNIRLASLPASEQQRNNVVPMKPGPKRPKR